MAPPPATEQATTPPVGEATPPDAPALQSTQPFEAKTTPAAGSGGAATQPPVAPPAAQKLTKLGDFRLVKKLGQGGMGAVFKAQQISLDREVAVKVLHKHLAADPAFVQRFEREARIMARLEHANTLRCLFVGQDHGFHYFAMEFIDGGSMGSWTKRLGKLEVGDALHVILACAYALQEAHEQGVVHRDMKPDNVLLTRKGLVKVADLGLAKAMTEDVSLTQTGTGAGTPVYMAPEQFRDVKHVDRRSDIYSLGCMLYQFLTGSPPFQGETFANLLEAKDKGEYPPARRSNDAVPPRLDLIIDKMLAKNPAIRYQTCAELIADLKGLGMANSGLSFLERDAAPKTTATPDPRPSVGPHRATKPAPETELPKPEYWYLCYTTSDGQVVTRKMTLPQAREYVKSPEFDLHTQASRTLRGDYRAIGTYPEFDHVLQGRVAKTRADRKTAQFRDLYNKIEKQEEARLRWKWLRKLTQRAVDYGGVLVWLGILALGCFIIYLVVSALMSWLGNGVETLQ